MFDFWSVRLDSFLTNGELGLVFRLCDWLHACSAFAAFDLLRSAPSLITLSIQIQIWFQVALLKLTDRHADMQKTHDCWTHLKTKQAFQKVSATAKGSYWQTYQKVDCWTACCLFQFGEHGFLHVLHVSKLSQENAEKIDKLVRENRLDYTP